MLVHRTMTTMMSLLSPGQVDQFARDGYIILSGLLEDDQIESLAAAGQALVERRPPGPWATFSLVEKGCIFLDAEANGESSGGGVDSPTAPSRNEFREVALRSKLAAVSAELMQLDPETQNCRVLRDVFLAKPVHGTTACDWHVDDQQFWPAQFSSEASQQTGKDQHGVNVWVALDDMPADCAGSMAVAPGSHRAEWRERAYEALGQDRNKDVDATMDDVVRFFCDPNRRGTCTIGNVDAELREMIEKLAWVVDVKRGDCIFCTRLMFHRTLDVTDKGKSLYPRPTLNRYSIRYVPGSTKLPGVYNSLDWAHMADEANAGRSLDEVVRHGECWYPQVWPTLEPNVDDKLNGMARSALVEAKAKLDLKTKELFAAVGEMKKKSESLGGATETNGASM